MFRPRLIKTQISQYVTQNIDMELQGH